ncbi:MAG: LPS translocon maturation chaperone LptM [Pseudohongiellaceae bacterium]
MQGFCKRSSDNRLLPPKKAGMNRALLFLCLLTSLLAGCGQKGGLTRPEQPPAINAQLQ